MRYRELPPHPALAADIRCYWFLEGQGAGAGIERIVPDGSPELILHLGDPYSRVDASAGTITIQERALVVGQLLGAFFIQPSRRPRIAAVRFEPQGLAAFLAVPGHELQDASVSALEAWGADGGALAERLADEASDEACARLLDAFLLQQRRRIVRSPDPRVAACVRELRQRAGAARIAHLAADAGMSERQLERLFLRDVGMGPKRLARVFRLQEALGLLRDPRVSLAEVAQAGGFADQPHLDREMRELAGLTPREYRAEAHSPSPLLPAG